MTRSSTVFSLASSTRSSAYFTVHITCPSILKSPKFSRASLFRYSLYKLNKIGGKQHPFLTPISILCLLFSPWSSLNLIHWTMYSLLINLLAHQSVPFPFRIYISLFQFSCSDVCQSMKKTHNSSLSKFRSDIILSISITSVFLFPLISPKWSFQITSSRLLSNFPLWILATLFALWEMKLIAGWFLHFVASGFLIKSIITSMKSLGHSRGLYLLSTSCAIIFHKIFFRQSEPIPRLLSAFLSLIFLIAFSM